MSEFALEIVNVSKFIHTDFWKKPYHALDSVSFQVPAASICGLIGPNGAGKTTTIKIILGFMKPSSGEIKIFGESHERKSTHQQMGFLPEQAYYYDYLNPSEFLDFYGKLFGLSRSERKERIDYLLNLVGLHERRNSKLKTFSKGMLQRIGIAQALINDPKLVILDEPMSGLDPLGRKEVRDIILQLKERGKTVLFSTHILPDVENLCDHAVMIVKGKIRASGTIGDLIKPNVQSFDVLVEEGRIPELPGTWLGKVKVTHFDNRTMIRFQKTSEIDQKSILDWIHRNHISLVSFTPHKETLEDILVRSVERS